MRIAYIGDFINHGKFLVPTGTSIVLLLSEISDVEAIDVYCPALNDKTEPFRVPEKVKIIESYSYDDPISILRLLKVRKKYYDKIIFNIMPTAFGNGNFSNLTGLMIPLMLRNMFRKNNIEVVYHNSVYTNDISKLGYDSTYDKLRSFILGIVEKETFKSVKTFVFLKLYKDRITKKIGNNQVNLLNGRYLEAITTVYMNSAYGYDNLPLSEKVQLPRILMHGSWGPQKNIELGLKALLELRKQGLCFDLIISGGVNHHFKDYGKKFHLILKMYNEIIKQYLGNVKEADIMKLFIRTDLLILPYNTPGGRSAVLEQAIFFEIPTIAIDFPEFKEQTEGISFIRLINSEESLKLMAKELLSSSPIKDTEINVKEMIQQAVNNIQDLVKR